MRRLFIAACLSLAVSSPSQAGWDEGLAAFESHAYGVAFQEWYPLAEAGDARAQAMVGYLYFVGHGAPQDYGKAKIWLSEAANQGSDFAQYMVGYMYESGKGVLQDYVEAVKWYRRAAEQGHADAQAHLGYLYADGRGVTQH